MKGNTEKCHLMLNTGDSNQIQIGNSSKAVSVWKTLRFWLSEVMKCLLQLSWDGKHHNLMQQNYFVLAFVQTVCHNNEILSYLGPKMWNLRIETRIFSKNF